jgi:hypothetical protein
MFGDVGALNASVALQLPILIRAMREPLGNAGLRIRLAAGHRDARLLAIGDDFFQAELAAVAENGDKGNKHRAVLDQDWLKAFRVPGSGPPFET